MEWFVEEQRVKGSRSLHCHHASNLIAIVSRHLLHHEFSQAAMAMDPLAQVMDHCPEVVRKAGIECLLNDRSAYGECLQFFKQIVKKHKSPINEKYLLEMAFFIAGYDNITEAYEVLSSHSKVDPYRSNPLIVGYCGLLAYLLWKEVEEAMEDRESEEKSLRHAKTALSHFEELNQLDTREANIEMFVHKHAELLVFFDKKSEALELLLSYREKNPDQINPNRYVCQHLRVHQPGDVALRVQHLGLLQRIDPSCPEVVEMVELGLNKGSSNLCERLFEVLVAYIDYPCNGTEDKPWQLLKQLQEKWPGYARSDVWLQSKKLWSRLYPERFQS